MLLSVVKKEARYAWKEGQTRLDGSVVALYRPPNDTTP